MSPCLLSSFFHSLSPSLFLPIPTLPLAPSQTLIHCSVRRSIERLSVRRSCTPHPQCLNRLETHSLLESWRSTFHNGEHPLQTPYSHIGSRYTSASAWHLNGILKNKKPELLSEEGTIWKQPEKIGYRHKTQCEKK